MNKLFLLLVFFVASQAAQAQAIKSWGIGPEVMYNVPIDGIGLGLRSHLHLNNRWMLAPQFALYPGWNAITEFYAGLNVNFNLTPATKWGLYLTAGPHYNHWMNFASSDFSGAQLMNFSAELGGGLVKNNGCFRPFIEYRANSKWWESNLRLGLLVYFGGCGGTRSHQVCPAYTML